MEARMTPNRRLSVFSLLVSATSSIALVSCGGTTFSEATTKESPQQGSEKPASDTRDGENSLPSERDAGRSSEQERKLLAEKPSGSRGIRSSVSDPATKRVLDACAASTKVKKTVNLVFQATQGNQESLCRWKSNPDGASDNIRGVYSQVQSVDLPEGSTLCGSRLFTATTTPWRYDDEVVLTLNDVILLTSQKNYIKAPDGTIIQKPVAGGWSFDWEALASKNLPNHQSRPEDRYCHGSDASKCSIPITEQQGQVRLDLATEAMAELSAKAYAERKVEFALWVTGDNEKAIDCKHSGITIQAELEYVNP